MQNRRVGIGVVGAGAIGIRGALMHLSLPDVQDRVSLIAVCDPVPGRAEAAAQKFGVAAHYTGYEELLADPRVEMVILCSPIGLHFEQGLQAIEAGKHIHFNKTMTTTADEASCLIDRAAEKGVCLVASPGQMLHPYNRRIRKLVLEGALGRLAWAVTGGTGVGTYHMKEEFRTGQDILTDVNPAWYFQKPGGGPQYDSTVYSLHALTGILGPARRVTALSGMVIPELDYHGQKIVCDMDDTTMLLIDFGDSLFAFVYAAVAGRLLEGPRAQHLWHTGVGSRHTLRRTRASPGRRPPAACAGRACTHGRSARFRGYDAAGGLGARRRALDRQRTTCPACHRHH